MKKINIKIGIIGGSGIYKLDGLKEFQKLSGFDYTDDQVQSIDEIIAQMSSGHIMDRLLSGDVGFGKTEVAMNTIFAAYKSGFQSKASEPLMVHLPHMFKVLASYHSIS